MFQHTGQELADNLKTCMTGIVMLKSNKLTDFTGVGYNALPDGIVVYHDGVGYGQIELSIVLFVLSNLTIMTQDIV